jgi:hypothetical protein
MEMSVPLLEVCREFRLDPAILRRRSLWSGLIDNNFAGFAPPEEFCRGEYHEGSRKGRNFSNSGYYTGMHSQLVLGQKRPMVILTLSRKAWTVEVAPYAQQWDGLLPVPFRPLKGRATFEAWEFRTGAPPDFATSAKVAAAIEVAQRRRRSTFIACAICRTTVPPEEVWGLDRCGDCLGDATTFSVTEDDLDIGRCDEV